MDYQLDVIIGQGPLQALSNDGYSLCFQKYLFADYVPTANVVAIGVLPGEYSHQNTFRWNNNYSIAATEGVNRGTATNIIPISATDQDAFVLMDWANYNVTPFNKDAPSNGFAFLPSQKITDPGASCTVYLNNIYSPSGHVNALSPFYTSPKPDIGGSINALIPLDRVIVSFVKDARTGSSLTADRTFPLDVELSTRKQVAYELYENPAGEKAWKEVPPQGAL